MQFNLFKRKESKNDLMKEAPKKKSNRYNIFNKMFNRNVNLKSTYEPVLNASPDILDTEILTQSLDYNAGIQFKLINPDKLLLEKGKNLLLYDTMLLDDRIKFTIDLKKMMVLSIPNKVVAASNDPGDQEKADFLQDMLDNLDQPTWHDTLQNLLDAMVYGFKVGEIIWNDKLVNGKWVWEKIKFKHSTFFDFDYDEFSNLNNVRIGYRYGFSTTIPFEQFEQKFIYLCWPYLKDGNYYGNSDLKEVYMQWWQKFNLQRWRGVYLQNFCMPIPEIVFDTNAVNKEELAEIDNTFNNQQELTWIKIPGKRDTQGVLKPKFEINYRDPAEGKDGAKQYNDTITIIDTEITRKLLFPDKLGFTTESAGSYAQAEKIFDIVIMNIRNIHRVAEYTVNEKLKQVIDLNFPMTDDDNYPKWKFDEITDDISELLLQTLINAKIIDPREKWIRSKMKVPEITEEEKNELEEKPLPADPAPVINNWNASGAAKPNIDPNNPQPTIEDDMRPNPNNQNNKNIINDNVNNINPINKTKINSSTLKANKPPIDYNKIQNQLDTFENDFIRDYNSIMLIQRDKLIKQIQSKKIIENKDYDALKKLQMSKTDLKKLLSTYYAKLYLTGKTDAIDEIKNRIPEKMKGIYVKFQDDNNDDNWLDRQWIDSYLEKYGDLGILSDDDKEYLSNLRDKAYLLTGQTEDKLSKIIYNVIDQGLRSGNQMSTIIAAVQDALDSDREQYAGTIARTNASDSYNTARMNLFMSDDVMPYIDAYQFSAVMDSHTTEFCKSHNGQIIKASDPLLPRINPPCHYNCRSVLIPIMIADDQDENSYYNNYQDKFSPWSGASMPAEGFGGV